MVMIDDSTIYIKNVLKDYFQYPTIYKLVNMKVKKTEEFGFDEMIIEEKMMIPINEFKQFKINNYE